MTPTDVNTLPPQLPFDDEVVETFLNFSEGYYFDCKRLAKLDRVIRRRCFLNGLENNRRRRTKYLKGKEFLIRFLSDQLAKLRGFFFL